MILAFIFATDSDSQEQLSPTHGTPQQQEDDVDHGYPAYYVQDIREKDENCCEWLLFAPLRLWKAYSESVEYSIMEIIPKPHKNKKD